MKPFDKIIITIEPDENYPSYLVSTVKVLHERNEQGARDHTTFGWDEALQQATHNLGLIMGVGE